MSGKLEINKTLKEPPDGLFLATTRVEIKKCTHSNCNSQVPTSGESVQKVPVLHELLPLNDRQAERILITAGTLHSENSSCHGCAEFWHVREDGAVLLYICTCVCAGFGEF